jgi:TP901 family phage tail tape measure protein
MSSLVGSAEGRIIIDIQEAMSNIDLLEGRVRGMDGLGGGALSGLEGATDRVDKFSKRNQDAGKAAGIFSGLVIGGFGFAASAAADFESQMSGVEAVMGADTWGQFGGEIEDLALRLGKDTTFGATEAAGAIEELSKQGISAENILGGAADATVLLAEASGTDLVTSAEIAATAMNQFGIAGKDMGTVADILTNGANKSSQSVESLGSGLQYVGTTASTLGIPLSDTVAALAALSDQGLKGSQAGTSLNRALSSIANPTGEAAKAMDELGLSMGQTNSLINDDGSFKDLGSIIENVDAATKNLTDSEKQRYINTIFGEQGGRAINALLKTQTEELQAADKGWDDYVAAVGETGTAQEQARIRMDNFAGSWEELKGTIETIGITIGSRLLGPMRVLVDFLAKVGDAFLNLPAPIQTAIAAVIGLAGVLAGLFAAFVFLGPSVARAALQFSKLTGIFPKIIQGIRGVSVALRLLVASNPLLLALAAIFAILFIAYQKNIFGFGDAVRKVASKVVDGLKKIVEIAKGVIDVFQGLWKRDSKQVVEGLSNIPGPIRGIVEAFVPLVDVVRTIVDAFQNAIDVFNRFRDQGVNPVSAALQAFGTFLRDLETGIGPIDALLNNLADLFRNLGQTISAFLDGDFGRGFDLLAETILSGIRALGSAMLLLPTLIMDALRGIDWGNVWSAVQGFAEGAIAKGGEIIGSLYDGAVAFWENTVLPWLRRIGSAALEAIPDLLNSLLGHGSKLIRGLYDGAIAFWRNTLLPWLRGIGSAAVEAIPALAGLLLNKGLALLLSLWEGVKHVWDNTILPFLTTLGSKILGAIPSLAGMLLNKGLALLLSLWEGIQHVWTNTILPFLSSLGSKILNAIPDLAGMLLYKGLNLLLSLWEGIQSVWNNTILPFLRSLGEKAVGAVPGMLLALYGKGAELVRGMKDGIDYAMRTVITWLGDLPTFLAALVPGMLESIYDKGSDLIQGFIDGLSDKAGELVTWFEENLSLDAVSGLIPDLSGIENPFASLIGFLGDLVTKAGEAIDAIQDLGGWLGGKLGFGGGGGGGEGGEGAGGEGDALASLGVAASLEESSTRIATAAAKIAGDLTLLGNLVKSFVANWGQWGLDMGTKFGENVETGLVTATTNITTFLTDTSTRMGTWSGLEFPAFGTNAGNRFQENLAKGLILANQSVTVSTNLMNSRLGTFSTDAGVKGTEAGSKFQVGLSDGLILANKSVTVSVNLMNSKLSSFATEAGTAGRTAGTSFATGVGNGMTTAVGRAQTGVNQIRSAMNSIGNQNSAGFSIGSSLGSGIASGISSWTNRIASAAAAVVRAGITAANNEAQTASPSRKMMVLGENMGEGLVIGLEGMEREVGRAFAGLIPSGDARGFQSGGIPGIGGAGVVNNVTVFALKSNELVRLMKDSETGASFARNMRVEVGMR